VTTGSRLAAVVLARRARADAALATLRRCRAALRDSMVDCAQRRAQLEATAAAADELQCHRAAAGEPNCSSAAASFAYAHARQVLLHERLGAQQCALEQAEELRAQRATELAGAIAAWKRATARLQAATALDQRWRRQRRAAAEHRQDRDAESLLIRSFQPSLMP
jgi:hypothetical protein